MTRAQAIDINPQPMYVDPGTAQAHVIRPNEPPVPVSGGSDRDESLVEATADLVPASDQSPVPPHIPVPNCEVAFELGEYGELVVSYHRVIVVPDRGLIALIFDTRFKAVGSRFSPASRRDSFNIRFRGETHRVVSLGIELTLADEHVHVIILLVDDSSSKGIEEDYNKSPAMGDLGPAFNMEMFDGKDR